MKRAVVIGGFATGETILAPVANELCRSGRAEDADVFTFVDAMANPAKIERAAKGALVVTHSAGILAVAREMRPAELVAGNGPEPRTVWQLASGAVRKMRHNAELSQNTNYLYHEAYAEIAEDNQTAGRKHVWAQLKRVGQVSAFSTFGHLAAAQLSDIRVAAIVTQEDEFFPYAPSIDRPKIVPVYEHEGNHDMLLAAPSVVLRRLPHDLGMPRNPA